MAKTFSPITAIVDRLAPGIRHPWLLAILAGLLAIDLVLPDPIPFIDEAVLALLTVLVASWRTRRDEPRSPPVDVTPADDADVLPPGGEPR
ncbi:MAG: hypothetical protein MUC56_10850 [Thermoanaerobaculales bacterium]|nr:hypothetical protein [Thermoanaerobaculales bacterium]